MYRNACTVNSPASISSMLRPLLQIQSWMTSLPRISTHSRNAERRLSDTSTAFFADVSSNVSSRLSPLFGQRLSRRNSTAIAVYT